MRPPLPLRQAQALLALQLAWFIVLLGPLVMAALLAFLVPFAPQQPPPVELGAPGPLIVYLGLTLGPPLFGLQLFRALQAGPQGSPALPLLQRATLVGAVVAELGGTAAVLFYLLSRSAWSLFGLLPAGLVLLELRPSEERLYLLSRRLGSE